MRKTLFVVAFIIAIAAAAIAPAAFADGGPLILCPPKAKNCVCSLPHC